MEKYQKIKGCYHSCHFFGSKPEMHCMHPKWEDEDSMASLIITHDNSKDGKVPEKCPFRKEGLHIMYHLDDSVYLGRATSVNIDKVDMKAVMRIIKEELSVEAVEVIQKIKLDSDRYQIDFKLDTGDALYRTNYLYLKNDNPRHTQIQLHEGYECSKSFREDIEGLINDFIFGEIDYK